MPALTAWEASGDPPEADPDAQEWTFRTTFERPSGGETMLCLDGVATVWEAVLNGETVAQGDSMFEPHRVDVGRLLRDGANELVIRCHALVPLLAQRRKPRARWRTQVVADGNLRWYRTTILGRAPGFAPGPPVVGPWRPVRLERRRPEVRLRAYLDGDDGVISAPGARLRVGAAAGDGELRLPGVARWWPHTHGEPVLHELEVSVDDEVVQRRRVGFRAIERGDQEGLDLRVNGIPVFCRGALWTPVSGDLRAALETVRDAGMNMLRLPGTGVYETEEFHALCDELGILVWQDFMFANMDYPIADPGFRATVEREAHAVTGALAVHPSCVVLCGNSEVEQQVAMLGLDPELGRGELFGELLPVIVAQEGCDAIYVPSSPSGGALPFRPDAGIAHYFGVGGYRRSLADARAAEVRFAGECLAIANAGDGDDALGDPPRDRGTDWDFADVRDHYLAELYALDPAALRAEDPERYLALSRAVSGEVMAEVFGEWRRAGSPCRGGLVLWLRDLVPGPGWGLVDHAGRPKEALCHLRRVLAPVAVWTTDEGMNGIAVHVVNDRPAALEAQLRVSLYRDGELPVGEAVRPLTLAAHGAATLDAEGVLGRFSDISHAYRFGEPQQDVVVASLERDGELLSQAFRFPVGRPLAPLAAAELGLEASLAGERLTVASRRVLYDVRVHAEGHEPSDDAFCIEPGHARTIDLRPTGAARAPRVTLTALNLAGELTVV